MNDANNVKLSQNEDINEGNIFWKFGENRTWWRHVTSWDVIFAWFFLKMRKKPENELTYLKYFNIKPVKQAGMYSPMYYLSNEWLTIVLSSLVQFLWLSTWYMSFLLIFAGFLMTSSKNDVMMQFFFVISKVIIEFYISTDFY